MSRDDRCISKFVNEHGHIMATQRQRMTAEDWFHAAVEPDEDGQVPYLRAAWVDGERLQPDDSVSLGEGELIVFDVDDGRQDRRFTARWNGEYITLL